MKRIYLLVLLLATCFYSRAQTSHAYFDKLDIKKGLPESLVRAVVEDTEGYIWIGTQSGLVRYDGYNYKIYQLGSPKVNISSVTNVFSIAGDDARKTIWVSVGGNGLFRYNRQTDTFEQFSAPSRKYFQYAVIKMIDAAGNVWGVINDSDIQKIFKLDIKTKKYELFSRLDKGNNFINASILMGIQQTSDGRVWFGTNNGLYAYRGANKPLQQYLTSTDTAKVIGANPVYEPASQPGVLWMNVFHGDNEDLRAACMDIKTGKIIKEYRRSNQPDSLMDAAINTIYEDKKKRLWFTTATGISKLDRQANKFTNYTFKDTAITYLNRIVEGKDGKFWMSLQNNLLYFDPDNGSYQFYKEKTGPGSITSKSIVSKMVDHTNTLWLGFSYGGANKLSKIKSAFDIIKEYPDKPNGYPGGGAYIISSTKDRNRVVAKNAIYNWRQADGRFSKIYSAEPGQKITDVFDKGDTLYIASNTGLAIYNVANGKKEVYRNRPGDSTSITANGISRVFVDHTGMVWLGIGNDQGLCSFDPKTKKAKRYPYQVNYFKLFIENDGSLDDGRVISMYEDRDGTFWVGTNAGSLNKFNRATGKFYSYYNKQNERMACISAIYEDREGRFWVGTYLTGVFEFDRKKGVYKREINEQSGLLYNSVLAINEDSAGKIWVGTERGLTRIDPKTMRLRNFRTDEILPGEDVLSFYKKPLADGTFALGLSNGLALFNPKDLDDDPYAPVVHLESIKYNTPGANDNLATQVLTYGLKQLELAHNKNSVQFNYIALHYENPANNTYAYKLEGYDKQWLQAGTNRTVTYNNLPPGTYTFKVKAANSSGVWNEEGDSIVVVVNPPWWSTWWAWVLYVLVTGAIIYYYIDYRSKHLQMENQQLEEKVNERTNELQVANKELNDQQEEITAQRDQLASTVSELKATQQQLIQSEKLASLGELTAGIAHEIQNPLNFVNNFSEVSIELAVEMKEELRSGSQEEAEALADDIVLNLEKIIHHGKRADGIVKNMLQHSRTNSGEKQPTDLNALVDEYLRLSYHGLRAKEKDFNSEMVLDLDPDLPKLNVIQQDFGRVMLNLFNNAFYAVSQRKKTEDKTYRPLVEVSTRLFMPPSGKSEVRIYVKDNGSGIADANRDKIMQPFFTTKPTGEGTGLGLSLSYDIIVKGHGGKMDLSSKEGEYTEFIIQLPVA